MRLFFASFFLSLSLFSFAETPTIDKTDQCISLNENLLYFIDSGGPLSFQEVLERYSHGEFIKNNTSQALNFGYDTKAYWFYTEFVATEDLEKVLNLPYPYHQLLNLHINYNNEWHHFETGNLKNFETRGLLKPENFAWLLEVEKGDTVQVLIQVKSKSPIIMAIEVHSLPHYIQTASVHNLFYGIFFGILLIMLLYNFFLYSILFDRAFLYYLLLVVTNIAVFASVTGYAFKYIYPHNPEINYYIREFLIAFLIIPTSLFAIAFLDLKRYSILFYNLLRVMIALGILICLSILIGYTLGFSSLIISVHAPLLLIIGIVVRTKGNKNANFYILAWTGYLLGGMAMTLRNGGYLPAVFITNHGAEIGAILEVFLLALALAYRYRQIRNESSRLQRENLALIQQQNIGLEAKVRERTKMLDSTLHMVQQQFDDLNNKNLEITSSLNYALKIQQGMLPEKQKIQANFKDVILFYKPKETVSGDFFFFEKSGDNIFIAVVDCTGHGVPGALLSMAGYNLFYDAINVEKLMNSKDILEYVDKNLRLRLNQNDSFVKDGMEAGLCIINRKTGICKFSGAQRPLLIVEPGRKPHLIKGSKRAIVGHINHVEEEFKEHIFNYSPSSKLYLFSDGFQDQFGGKEDKKYLSKRLVHFLQSISEFSGNKQEHMIEEEFQKWKGNGDQIDDIVILGVKI